MDQSSSLPEFRKPRAIEALLNRAMGFLVGLGIGPSYMYLLQVRGRKTGRVYSTPVNLLEIAGKPFLVAPRGRTQWVRNAESAGEISLKRGNNVRQYRLRQLNDEEKLQVLKTYLDTYQREVQRYFAVPAGSEASAFRAVAQNYPVFELVPG
jgi:deazaflavin-dependent oxidoreductase (nitroreductase family)